MRRILPCGDSALSVELGNAISPHIHGRVLALRDSLEGLRGIVALVPTYRSLFVQYDPMEISFEALSVAVDAASVGEAPGGQEREGPLLEIPVCYDPALAPDLAEVASRHDLSVGQVAALQCAPAYRVYMLGFTPGFAFLGGLDPRLHTPRLPEPRSLVPAGSVGVAGSQTGAYAIPGPGGWRLVGRTPFRLFDPRRAEPALLQPGFRVRFREIGLEEFCRLGGEP